MEAMAPYVAGFSDDGKGVQSEKMMLEAMKLAKSLGKVISAHCEDNSPAPRGYHPCRRHAAAHGYKGISAESEWKFYCSGPGLGGENRLRLPCVPRVHGEKRGSDPSGKEIWRGRDLRDPDPTTCPLRRGPAGGRALQDEPAPALPEDQDALVEGLQDGTVDMVATDHAPTAPRKNPEVWREA